MKPKIRYLAIIASLAIWHGSVGIGYVFSKPVDVYALSVNWLFGE